MPSPALHKLTQFVRHIALSCILALAAITSCSPPADKQEATTRVIAHGLARPGSEFPHLYIGLGLLSLPDVQSSKKACEGSIGSILPTLAINYCPVNTVGQLQLFLNKLQFSLKGIEGNPYRRHLYLNGIEQFWVQQSEPNNCWAATLETARRYMQLRYMSQDELLSTAQNACPALREQTAGAEFYQITYALADRLTQYDKIRTTPGICENLQCIIERLGSGHPIIALGSGHAVLLVGLDYVPVPGKGGPPIPVVEQIYILDPAGNGQVETKSSFALCSIDIFLAY